MLHVVIGTDRKRARSSIAHAHAKNVDLLRLDDTGSTSDMRAATQGAGLFGDTKQVFFDNVSGDEALRAELIALLPVCAESNDDFFVYEEKPNAELKRALQKHAHVFETYELPKKEKDTSVFALSNALKRGDKKALWVSFRTEMMKGKAPEAVHGVLFWGAKDMVLKARAGSAEYARGASLVARLAELPHEARRRGVELEYALEAFLLTA